MKSGISIAIHVTSSSVTKPVFKVLVIGLELNERLDSRLVRDIPAIAVLENGC